MRDVARLIATGSLVLCCAGALAQPAGLNPTAPRSAENEPLPEAAEVFERYIEAIGGREAIQKIKNRRIEGTFQGEPFEFRANLQVWWESDGRFHQNVSEPAGLRYNIYANGEYTWVQLHDQEPHFLGGMQRIELLDTADFHGEANYEERYKEITTIAAAKADEQPVYVIRAVTHANRPHTLYFNRDTGLLVGTRVPTMGRDKQIREMTVRLGEYKPYGGVLYPTLLEQQFAGSPEISEYRYSKIEVNVEDDHDYSVPSIVVEQYEQALANDAAKAAEKKPGVGG